MNDPPPENHLAVKLAPEISIGKNFSEVLQEMEEEMFIRHGNGLNACN